MHANLQFRPFLIQIVSVGVAGDKFATKRVVKSIYYKVIFNITSDFCAVFVQKFIIRNP